MFFACYTPRNHDNSTMNKILQDDALNCAFKNLTEIDCTCKYFSIKMNKKIEQSFTYTGDELKQWAENNKMKPFNYDSLSESTKIESFAELFEHCNEKSNGQKVRCILKCNKSTKIQCYCLDSTSPKLGQQSIFFSFKDVFTDHDFFSNENMNTATCPPPSCPSMPAVETIPTTIPPPPVIYPPTHSNADHPLLP